jgi:hypothetical protein
MLFKKNLPKQKSKPAAPMPLEKASTSVNAVPNQTPDTTDTTTALKQQPRDTEDDAIMLLHTTIGKQK